MVEVVDWEATLVELEDVADEAEVIEEDLIEEAELVAVEATDEVDPFDVVLCVELDGEELPESAT